MQISDHTCPPNYCLHIPLVEVSLAKNERKASFLVPVSENFYCVKKGIQMGSRLWLLNEPRQVASVRLLSTLSGLLYYSGIRSSHLSVIADW